jgi:beta-lysine 5,6-aminomutase beta subunit
MTQPKVDLTAVRPYADHLNDGLVQMTFTLPVPHSLAARTAALELSRRMGLTEPDVVHSQPMLPGYSFFTVSGRCEHAVDFSAIAQEAGDEAYLSGPEIEDYVAQHVGRPIVVVGASTGSDTHSVGIDAMLNAKGFHGDSGLESYRAFVTYNMGSQVANSALVAKAYEVGADAILVSQTVTQQGLHIQNLTALAEILEAEGRRDDIILVCGGPRITDELAKELGFDVGFSRGTLPHHLATFLAREVAARFAKARD